MLSWRAPRLQLQLIVRLPPSTHGTEAAKRPAEDEQQPSGHEQHQYEVEEAAAEVEEVAAAAAAAVKVVMAVEETLSPSVRSST